MKLDNALEELQYLAVWLDGAVGRITADYGEVTGKHFQAMTMCPEPVKLAEAMNNLPTIIAALRASEIMGKSHNCQDSTRANEPREQGEVVWVGADLLGMARRNLRAYIRSATFRVEVDRLAANNCLDVIEQRLIAQGREQAEAEIVAWLLTSPPVIGLSQMAAWNTAAHIEREEYKEPKP